MKELEVKVLNIDEEKIKSKLIEIKAKLIKDEYQYNYVFDTKDRYLKKRYRGYLRIRKTISKNKIEKIFLTLKKNISNDILRENTENNLKIDNIEEGIEILESLGYKLLYQGEKQRVSYEYEDIIFEIDKWDKETYPKAYLEIEVKKEKDLEKAIKLLKLNKKDITKKSIEELRRDFEKERQGNIDKE